MLKNIASTVFSHYTSQVIALITNILLARYLGGEGFGEYTLISSVFLIGNAFTTFGMDMILIRILASKSDPFLLGDGLLVQLFLSALYIAGVFLFDFFSPVPYSLKVYVFSLIPLAFYTIFTIVVRSQQKMQVYAIAQFLISFFQFIAMIVFTFINGNINTLSYLFLFSYALIAIWGYAFYTSSFVQIKFSLRNMLTLMRDCLKMAAIGTVRLIYEKIVATLLPGLVGLANTGIFSIAWRLMSSGKLGYFSAFTAIYPAMAKDVEIGRKMKGLVPLLGTSIVFSLLLQLLAKPIILVLFGVEFLPSTLSLQIMAWSIVPYVLITYITLGLVALELERPILISAVLGLIALLVLLIPLTTQFGITGSAIAVLGAEVFYAGVIWFQWRKHVLSKLSG